MESALVNESYLSIYNKGSRRMEKENSEVKKAKRSMYILAMVNVGIWAIAIIAMVFLIQHSPIIKRIFPILVAGTGVGIALISSIAKLK